MRTSYSVIKDADGRNIVIINDIRFRGKRNIDWKEVEEYLKQYIDEFYEIADTKDIVYVGNDFLVMIVSSLGCSGVFLR